MATADPDVLYSTAAQATAALVAIVGGFLVSRLVALSSERGSLVARVKELELSLRLAEARFEEIHSERLAVSKHWFVDHHSDGIFQARGDVDVEALLRDFIPAGSSHDEMRPVAEDLVSRTRTTFERVTNAFKGSELASANIELLRERIPDIDPADEMLYEQVGNVVGSEQRHSLGIKSSALQMPSLVRRPTSDIVVERQYERIREERRARSQVEGLKHELDFVRTALGRFGRPEGVRSGIAVLMYFSLVGIVLPMVLMSARPVPDSILVRVLAIATFVSGLVLLLCYIGWLARKLQQS